MLFNYNKLISIFVYVIMYLIIFDVYAVNIKDDILSDIIIIELLLLVIRFLKNI